MKMNYTLSSYKLIRYLRGNKMATNIILLSFAIMLVKVLFMNKQRKSSKIVEWMKNENQGCYVINL